MILVSSANNIESDTEFTLMWRSFIHIMHNTEPRIDTWGNPYFNVPQLEKTS